MCKPFPPPLVRGGVFLVGSDTKYRDIADGNATITPGRGGRSTVRYQVPRYSGWKLGDLLHRCADVERLSDTKYRDIADGNGRPDAAQSASVNSSDTKYRDIADGNSLGIP